MLALVSPEARFQPVHVLDVARAVALALSDPRTFGQTFELCGPRAYTLRKLVEYVVQALGLRRPIVGLGPSLSMLQAAVLEQLPGSIMTRDNVRSMQVDNVCDCPFPEVFGFAPTPQGFVTVPQLGRVLIGDDVEVGANSTIDRGSAQDTVIGAGSRIDNLVQIGHNVRLGRCCVIVSQSGISGSTVLGDFVQLGGQAGLTGHLTIGDGARIGAQSGVMADVPAKADVVGAPAMPVREFFRNHATLQRMIAREQAERSRRAGAGEGAGTEAKKDRD